MEWYLYDVTIKFTWMPCANVLISRSVTNKRYGWSRNRNDIAIVTTAQICPIWHRSLTWLRYHGSIWVASPGVRDISNVRSRYKRTQTAFRKRVYSCQTAREIRAVNKYISCYKKKKTYHIMLQHFMLSNLMWIRFSHSGRYTSAVYQRTAT